ncbi:MAG: NUDIX domain-containing protein [Holosporaceae bacterium]|jgi:8-oxo-dGTP pyrophosphatase MutT (NUDIX family)|nr:NUDIX domain-containing protein [Holosporaceae bacterium]
MKLQAYVAVFLLLKKNDEFLLLLRQNTVRDGGNWGLVSGHVEKDEGIIDALIRETKEEADIHVNCDDLKIVNVITHNKTDRPYVNLFFACEKYSGEICNAEPHKCCGMQFFKETELPPNIVGVVKLAIENIRNGIFFSELELSRI